MNMMKCRAGDVVFRQGDEAQVAYLIETGKIEISIPENGNKKVLAVLGPGEVFGEMGPVDGYPRSADATALTDALLMPVDSEQIMRRLEVSDSFVVGLFKVMSGRLRSFYGLPTGYESNPEEERPAIIAELKREQLIREGLEAAEFVPHFQPIVELSTQRVAGFEALVRWQQETGLVPPNDFIPLAERSGLIRLLDLEVLRLSCGAIKKMNAQTGQRLFLSANLSAQHFADDEMVESVRAVVDELAFDPALLKLEITESALIKHADRAKALLTALKDYGVTIALDDFGTGYSSLSYLHHYPIDVLKIDRSFVSRMTKDSRTERILDAMISMARSLDMQIVAEGIEAKAEAQALLEKGVDFGQGWLFGRPLPASEAYARLQKDASFREVT